MVFFGSPLELFSLEREGRPVAGRPFRHSGRFATNRARAFSVVSVVLLLMQAARRHAGLAASISGQNFVAALRFARIAQQFRFGKALSPRRSFTEPEST